MRAGGVQFPQWRGLPVRPVASHETVNAIFRVGAGLVARFRCCRPRWRGSPPTPLDDSSQTTLRIPVP
jgi:hypothetical protein